MSDAGRKIIDGLKEALAGNLARVTIDGVTWVRKEELKRKDAEIERLTDCLREFDEFAWTAVTADCEEARQNLQRKIDKARAALTVSEGDNPKTIP